jgi:ABC-2 type transport system permease protein
MFARIAAFEFRYQLRNPVFWVVAIAFFLLAFGGMTIPEIQIGSGTNVHRNSPIAIGQYHLIFSLFYMFVTTAFVANVIVRDDESGFGPMVKSTRVTKFDYLFARFLGAFLVAALSFIAVPLAILLGSAMPWLDAETIGPNRLGDYLFAYSAIALPNILLTSAIFFAVATMTRSMMYSYVGVVVFFGANTIVGNVVRAQPDWRWLSNYIEPFGASAFNNATRYWTMTELNAGHPALAGPLLANRLIWFGVALAALGIAYWRFSFSERGVSARRLRRQQRRDAKLAAAPVAIAETLPAARPGSATWARLVARTRLEMAMVFRSPAFSILMLIGLLLAGVIMYFSGKIYGTETIPLTFVLIPLLGGSFGIVQIIIAIYYAGELVWRDRDRKMNEIIDATSLPNWAYLVPKMLAVTAVLFASMLISTVAGILMQLFSGQFELELGKYFFWHILPATIDMVLMAVMAVFIQALSPNKYLGWGLMVLYIIATLILPNIGFEHPLYLYGSTGSTALSDMNGARLGAAAAWWLRLYWGCFALIFAVLAHLLWRRGTAVSLKARLALMPRRLAGVPGVLIAAALVVAAGSGGYIYYNMDVLNHYRTDKELQRRLADYEKKYLRYENLAQPSTTAIKLNVALYPAEHRAIAQGSYALVNDTGAPLADLHVRFQDPDIDILALDVPGAKLAMDDADNKYRIYHFAAPLAPGATASLSFTTRRWQRGFRAGGDDVSLVDNGTFLNNGDFAPQIGMSRDGLLNDRTIRRKFDLKPELRMAKLEDTAAQARNYIGNADWVMSDITVSTVAGQTPIAPGREVSDVTKDGRRTAHFVSTAPILAFFSIQSAHYAVKSIDADGVKLSVYYHPRHSYNVDRMLAAMKASLAYYRRNYGPYQFDYARIIEFPGYREYAQSFAGTIPYSEKLGFIADARNRDDIDYVTYITAHELGHQYWAHQLIGADMQGGTMLVESMAQYSALMVMKQLYGEDKIRRFLKFELDSYLRSRGTERTEELPLDRVENQQYIHYRKGAVVLYLLQDRLGEDRVDHMLSQLLDKYRFKGPPYARSWDLVQGFLSLARNPAEHELVLDLLDRITIYDLKAPTATTHKLADGRWETSITVDAAKFYVDGKGNERATPLSDTIDIGLFDLKPGLGVFATKDVISMARLPVKSGKQVIRVISARKPAFAGVDPYNKYIDRNSDDNVVAVTAG